MSQPSTQPSPTKPVGSSAGSAARGGGGDGAVGAAASLAPPPPSPPSVSRDIANRAASDSAGSTSGSSDGAPRTPLPLPADPAVGASPAGSADGSTALSGALTGDAAGPAQAARATPKQQRAGTAGGAHQPASAEQPGLVRSPERTAPALEWRAGARSSGSPTAGPHAGPYENVSVLSETAPRVSASTPRGRPVGMNVSAAAAVGTPLQDALVSLPTGRSAGSAAALPGGFSPASTGGARQAELRGMLITAEREVAELREECARRGMALDGLEAALDRERISSQALRDRHADELADARSEHEAQTTQLREQLRVLKMVSESAMAEKSKTAEEAARRKRELLALLERERAEKSYLMADYREQTESLIAEQGREITALRAALEKVKAEFDRLSEGHEQALHTRDTLGEQVEELRDQLDRERLDSARRLKDVQGRLSADKEALQESLDAKTEEHARDTARAQERQQQLAEQLAHAQEEAVKAKDDHQRSAEALKEAYRRDVEGLEKELKTAAALRERQDEEHRKTTESAARATERTVAALRQTAEEARAQCEAATADGLRQRDELQAQHRAKAAQLQSLLEAANKELSSERALRKDAESANDVLRARAENLEKSVQSLHHELETTQVTFRAKERSGEAAHQAVLEELRGKLRSTTNDLGNTQQQLSERTEDTQRLRDELASRAAALERALAAVQDAETRLEAEAVKGADALQSRVAALQVECDALKAQNTNAAAQQERLDRALKDSEAMLQSAVRQGEQERAALESAGRELADARAGAEELRQSLAREQARAASFEGQHRAALEELQEARMHADELEASVRMGERKSQESAQDHQRQLKSQEGKLADQAQRHTAELAAARLSTEQLRGELTRLREALVAKEQTQQALREEVNQLHREAALREGALAEELDDAKDVHEEEVRRMDELLNGLRGDLVKSQQLCTQYQQQLAAMRRSADSRYEDLEAALEQSEGARARLQDDAKYREQLNQELQGTVRLLTARLSAHEEETRRTHEELMDVSKKVQDAHTLIGRKDAAIGQLNAKLRAYESRGGVL